MSSKPTIKTPFDKILPPLSIDEMAALRASINAKGVLNPVLVDEAGNVLDGHHRLKIDPNAPTKVVPGLSTDAEKKAFVFQSNNGRRNLTPRLQRSLRRQMCQVANALRQQDPKTFTQKVVAGMIGVSQACISGWFRVKGGTNINTDNGIPPSPDARRKVPEADRSTVADRVKKGESKKKIAKSLGVTPRAVTKIAESVSQKTSGKGSAAGSNAVTSEAQQVLNTQQHVEDSAAVPMAAMHRCDNESSHTPFDEVIGEIQSMLESLKPCNGLTQKIEELVAGAIDVKNNVNSANNLTNRFTQALKSLEAKAAEFRAPQTDDQPVDDDGEPVQDDDEDEPDYGRPSPRAS